jgi:hypothetical protein
MKKYLLPLCVCGFLAQSIQSQALSMPSWNTVLDSVSSYIQSWKIAEDKAGVLPKDDSDETIFIGSSSDEADEIIEEQTAFDFDFLPEIDPAIRLLSANHHFINLADSDALEQINLVFQKDAQAGINLFISLHKADAKKAVRLFIDKNFSDELRLAVLKDTPAVYAAVLLHNLRVHLKGQEIYHRGSYTFSNHYYGTLQADYALISGELIPAQYLPFIILHDLKVNELDAEEQYRTRVNRVAEILFSMEKEQLQALFIYQPEEAYIKIGLKNKNYCLGGIKKENLCDIPMEGGINEQFVVAAFDVFSDRHIDVVAAIIEHEYTHFRARGKNIIARTRHATLVAALEHIKDPKVYNAVSLLRPEVIQNAMQAIIGTVSSQNLLSDSDSTQEEPEIIKLENDIIL